MSDSNSTLPEGFRQIPGFPRYCISEYGIVLSAQRKRPWSKAKQLSPVTVKDGYLAFNLSHNGVVKQLTIHRLVLTTFVGERPDGHQCRHLDGNQHNNHISNLAWGTSLENIHDKKLHGTDSTGECNPSAKLNESDVLEIRRRRESGEPLRVIAKDFNISVNAVWAIHTRLTWKHVQS